MNKDIKEQILSLKRSGRGYKTISRETGVNLNTVKSICRRSGLFRDNPEHRALFTIPETKYSTELATIKPLPPQRVITGHKQTDAYLWVLEVIKTGEPVHIAAAEAALEKLTITPKEAQERYTRYLQHSGAGWTSVFSTMWLDNPQHFISSAKSQRDKAAKVRGAFGSYDAAMEPTKPERLMMAAYGEIYGEGLYGWTEEEKAQGRIKGDRIFEAWDARKAVSKGFRDVLPEPYTLSDVVREYLYWAWLVDMRSAAIKEIDPDGYGDDYPEISDREDYLDKLLETISPRNQQEALEVLKWYLQSERHQGCMDADSDGVYLNLIGAHNAE
ncbi:hypothetical protein [Citrobacter freundii]